MAKNNESDSRRIGSTEQHTLFSMEHCMGKLMAADKAYAEGNDSVRSDALRQMEYFCNQLSLDAMLMVENIIAGNYDPLRDPMSDK